MSESQSRTASDDDQRRNGGQFGNGPVLYRHELEVSGIPSATIPEALLWPFVAAIANIVCVVPPKGTSYSDHRLHQRCPTDSESHLLIHVLWCSLRVFCWNPNWKPSSQTVGLQSTDAPTTESIAGHSSKRQALPRWSSTGAVSSPVDTNQRNDRIDHGCRLNVPVEKEMTNAF